MKKIISIIMILIFSFSVAVYADGEISVTEFFGTTEKIKIKFSDDVYNAAADVIYTDKENLIYVSGASSIYNSIEKTLTVDFENELSLNSRYKLEIRYGVDFENKYEIFFKFRTLKSVCEMTIGNEFSVMSLKDENEVFDSFRNYTVEFELEKQKNSDFSVAFYANKSYNMNWNYHAGYGITLSSDKEGQCVWDVSNPLSDELPIENKGATGEPLEGKIKASASVFGNEAYLIEKNSNSEKYEQTALLPFDNKTTRSNYGTFGISCDSETKIKNLVCYKTEIFSASEYEAKIHNIEFEKNADTIANSSLSRSVTVSDYDGNPILNDKGNEITFNADYAEIGSNWFNGLPANQFGMYFSGFKSSAFPQVGDTVNFSRVYREDIYEENSSELTKSKYISSNTEYYQMTFDRSGYESKVNDAFLLVNKEGADYHSPSLTAKLNNVKTLSVRFAAQTNNGGLTVKVGYSDGSEDISEIETGQHGNIVYSSNWQNYYKYFALKDEKVKAGIIGEYVLRNGTALYPWNYKTIYDYSAVGLENTASTDIRYKENGIRYYNPRLFLFEVKTDENKIAEYVTISAKSAYPMAIYSISQCEKVSDTFICSSYERAEHYVSAKLNESDIYFKNYTPILAVYGENGELLGIGTRVENGCIKAKCEGEKAVSASLMFWSDSEAMTPVAPKINIEFKDAPIVEGVPSEGELLNIEFAKNADTVIESEGEEVNPETWFAGLKVNYGQYGGSLKSSFLENGKINFKEILYNNATGKAEYDDSNVIAMKYSENNGLDSAVLSNKGDKSLKMDLTGSPSDYLFVALKFEVGGSPKAIIEYSDGTRAEIKFSGSRYAQARSGESDAKNYAMQISEDGTKNQPNENYRIFGYRYTGYGYYNYIIDETTGKALAKRVNVRDETVGFHLYEFKLDKTKIPVSVTIENDSEYHIAVYSIAQNELKNEEMVEALEELKKLSLDDEEYSKKAETAKIYKKILVERAYINEYDYVFVDSLN